MAKLALSVGLFMLVQLQLYVFCYTHGKRTRPQVSTVYWFVGSTSMLHPGVWNQLEKLSKKRIVGREYDRL